MLWEKAPWAAMSQSAHVFSHIVSTWSPVSALKSCERECISVCEREKVCVLMFVCECVRARARETERAREPVCVREGDREARVFSHMVRTWSPVSALKSWTGVTRS